MVVGRCVAPPLLKPGARVALVAPSGPLRDDADLARAVANVESFGWEPLVASNARSRSGYFAGDDATRLAAINEALRDPGNDAIWMLRGGYGASRLLRNIDFAALAARPRAVIGYSDITALHSAILRKCQLVTFHGPTARAGLTDFSRKSMTAALLGGGDPCGTAAHATVLRSGSATGALAGGNLALLSSLCGTEFAPDFDGAIVVLEDVNEAVYRIDRMLLQLRMSGAFDGCRAIVFGSCNNCPEDADDGARTLAEVLEETADELNVPCVVGVPVGHIADQWTVPLGAQALLVAEGGGVRLEVLRQ